MTVAEENLCTDVGFRQNHSVYIYGHDQYLEQSKITDKCDHILKSLLIQTFLYWGLKVSRQMDWHLQENCWKTAEKNTSTVTLLNDSARKMQKDNKSCNNLRHWLLVYRTVCAASAFLSSWKLNKPFCSRIKQGHAKTCYAPRLPPQGLFWLFQKNWESCSEFGKIVGKL